MNRRKCRSGGVIILSSSSSSSGAEMVDNLCEDVEGGEEESSSHRETDDEDDEVSSYCPSGDDDSDLSGTDADDYDDSDGDRLHSDEETDQEERSTNVVPCRRGDQDDDSLYNLVIESLRGRKEGDLRKLTLSALRVYLRRHGLRISGSKDVCLTRTQEHWRIKDGNGEILYPRSSFTINCKGDVCKGDVVLFTQKVYNKFDKVKRCGEVLGKRTVAGRVVKESYGTAKQQHTFTVEVFWSRGAHKLPPLFPLLVKGRNLYRMSTFRQPWKNEAERIRVLDEKHSRGALARQKRDIRIRSRDARKKTCSSYGHSNPSSSSLARTTQQRDLTKTARGSRSKVSSAEQLNGLHLQNVCPPKHASSKNEIGGNSIQSNWRNGKEANCQDKYSRPKPYADASHQKFYGRQWEYTDYRGVLPYGRAEHAPCPTYSALPTTVNPYRPHRVPYPTSYGYRPLDSTSSLRPFEYERAGFQQCGFFRCSRTGCGEFGSEACATSSCWRCCLRTGVRCRVHHQWQ